MYTICILCIIGNYCIICINCMWYIILSVVFLTSVLVSEQMSLTPLVYLNIEIPLLKVAEKFCILQCGSKLKLKLSTDKWICTRIFFHIGSIMRMLWIFKVVLKKIKKHVLVKKIDKKWQKISICNTNNFICG